MPVVLAAKSPNLKPTTQQIAKAEEEIAILHSFRIGILTDPSYLCKLAGSLSTVCFSRRYTTALEIPSNSASKKRFAERVESRVRV